MQKSTGDFPHIYEILISGPHFRGGPIGKGRPAPKEELRESVAYRPHLDQTGEKDDGILQLLEELAELMRKFR